MTDHTEAEREKFEAWCNRTFVINKLTRWRDSYEDVRFSYAWEAWQARATQASAPADLLKKLEEIGTWDCHGDSVSDGCDEVFGAGTWESLLAHLRAPAVVSQQLQTEAAGAAPPAQQWLPIADAPKDGSLVLLCTDGGIVFVGKFRKHLFLWVDDEGRERFRAVKWFQPLPPAPQHQGANHD